MFWLGFPRSEMGGKVLGALLMLASALVAILYSYLLLLAPDPIPLLTLKATALILVLAGLGIVAWIGYVLLITEPPGEIEELVRELEEKGELS